MKWNIKSQSYFHSILKCTRPTGSVNMASACSFPSTHTHTDDDGATVMVVVPRTFIILVFWFVEHFEYYIRGTFNFAGVPFVRTITRVHDCERRTTEQMFLVQHKSYFNVFLLKMISPPISHSKKRR